MNLYHHAQDDVKLMIERLLQFAIRAQLIEQVDRAYVRNLLLDQLHLNEPYTGEIPNQFALEQIDSPVPLLETILDYAAGAGLLTDHTMTTRDLLDAKIMGLLTPRPAQVIAHFWQLAEQRSRRHATDYLYQLSIDANYIRMDRIRKNLKWLTETPYGDLEITINLSKPEKDPKEIAMLKNAAQSNYPRCLLCVENVGYAGRIDHPARQNLRVIPVQLIEDEWYFQYSPYVYYQEHCIIFSGQHMPMKISKATFARILEFIDQFPHYFVGSNADIPIVGGSILNHDHFQGGQHVFPMEIAQAERVFLHPDFPYVKASIIKWPMSVVRLSGKHRDELLELADYLLLHWKAYSDSTVDIYATSTSNDGHIIAHQTVTPIGRFNRHGEYELDLVLRNNRTSEDHPEGIFHPHRHLHHVKRENIGLIEVMGLAVLPGRLQQELAEIAKYLTGEVDDDPIIVQSDTSSSLHKHAEWMNYLIATYGTKRTQAEAQDILKHEVGLKFLEVLYHAGVFKRDREGQEAFDRFLGVIGFQKTNE